MPSMARSRAAARPAHLPRGGRVRQRGRESLVPTDDQQVEVLVNPTAFANGGSGDKWVGAMTRYSGDSNYYYVSLRSGGTLSLRKVVNGTIGVLATATMPVTPNNWYSLRLEAVGSRLRAYVNGTP